MAFDHPGYMPVLLTRRGERSALDAASHAVRSHLTPMFVMAPVDLVWPEEIGQAPSPKRTVSDHVTATTVALKKTWAGLRAFCDTVHLDSSARMADGTHPLQWAVQASHAASLTLVPVTGIHRGEAHQAAAADAHRNLATGICLRLELSDVTSIADGKCDDLFALLRLLEARPEEIDIVFDVADDVPADISATVRTLRDALHALPNASMWRSLTIAAAAFPVNLSGLAGNSMHRIPRRDWQLYESLVSNQLPRIPSYGDYGIAHPDPKGDLDPRLMTMSANLRYTCDKDWLVAKGSSVRQNGFEQAVTLAHHIVHSPDFCGAAFSWGDAWLQDCAEQVSGCGNAETWRKVGTSHHLAKVTHQHANLLGISGAA